MENIELTLNKNKSFSSINKIQNLDIDLEREEKLLPVNDLQGKIDAYEQYLQEKDACNKYRFVFTIHPYCTNVLFNHITEAVYHEGCDYTKMVTMENDAANLNNLNCGIGYATYKDNGITIEPSSPITRDTGYSCNSIIQSDKLTNFLDYHCGIDIFNNHLLRRKEFVCINPYQSKNKYFNTLFDEVRDPWGRNTKGFTYQANSTSGDGATVVLHLYNKDSVYSFKDAISHNLREENGWLGFNNQSLLESVHVDGCNNINKVINNHDACTFIDMYPTRQYYSFVPFFNQYRKRLEKNWEYTLTYPYKNIYNHYLTYDSSRKIYGILCDLELPSGDGLPGTANNKITVAQLLGLDTTNPVNTPLSIMFHSHMNHNILPGDKIRVHIYNSKNTNKSFTNDNIVVNSIGDNGYDAQHYFSLRLNDISTDLELAYNLNTSGVLYLRFEKMVTSKPCRYYIRKFRKLPNFKNTKINVNDGITDDEINEALTTSDFSSSLNKLGFSKTIYGDDVSQIVFDDDIDVTGLRDNLGRELSVLYLTFVKTNYGYNEWYEQNNYTASTIEYSHCFGNLTSGFNLPAAANQQDECNVRLQHNIDRTGVTSYIPKSSDTIETGLSIHGTNNDYEFYGDIVEFNEITLEETVLERIHHRFNTAQRETRNSKFSKLIVDDIIYDDYTGGFKPGQWNNGNLVAITSTSAAKNAMCSSYVANLAPEGYYYQAHYPIRIKEYDTIVNTGYHTQIKVISVSGSTIITDSNYYLETGGEVYLFNMSDSDNTRYIARVGNVGGDDFTTVELMLPNDLPDTDLNNYILFKPNILEPEGAYDLGNLEQPEFREKTGRYIWRDVLPSSNIHRDSEIYDLTYTNDAIYIHKDINFYLKRQDPYGEYGLQPKYANTSDCIQLADLEITGNNEDITDGDYFEPGENNIC